MLPGHSIVVSLQQGGGGIFFPFVPGYFFVYSNHIPVTSCIRIQNRILYSNIVALAFHIYAIILNAMPFLYFYLILVTWWKDLPEHTFLFNLKNSVIRSLYKSVFYKCPMVPNFKCFAFLIKRFSCWTHPTTLFKLNAINWNF